MLLVLPYIQGESLHIGTCSFPSSLLVLETTSLDPPLSEILSDGLGRIIVQCGEWRVIVYLSSFVSTTPRRSHHLSVHTKWRLQSDSDCTPKSVTTIHREHKILNIYMNYVSHILPPP